MIGIVDDAETRLDVVWVSFWQRRVESSMALLEKRLVHTLLLFAAETDSAAELVSVK